MSKAETLILIFFIILFMCFVCLLKQNEVKTPKNSFNPTSEASARFYSEADTTGHVKKLTIAQVREVKIFENISDEDAKEIINGLYSLSIITYNIFKYGTGKI
ncbi:MAG: hypothetical protein WAQ28_01030 [Bacteroidia bacterium]